MTFTEEKLILRIRLDSNNVLCSTTDLLTYCLANLANTNALAIDSSKKRDQKLLERGKSTVRQYSEICDSFVIASIHKMPFQMRKFGWNFLSSGTKPNKWADQVETSKRTSIMKIKINGYSGILEGMKW